MAKTNYDVQGLIARLNDIDKYKNDGERIIDCSIEDGCVVALMYQYFEDEDFSPEDYWESIDAVEVKAIMSDECVSYILFQQESNDSI